MPGIQFDWIGFDQRIKYVVTCTYAVKQFEWKLVKLETSNRYGDTSRECFLAAPP